MSELVETSQIQLDQLFQAVVAEYDAISPRLIEAGVPMTMKRALLPRDQLPPIKTRDEMTPGEVSGHEGHCIGDGYVWGRLVLQDRFDIKEFPSVMSGLAASCTDIHTAEFNRVACYLKVHAFKKAAAMRGISVSEPAHEGLLEAMLRTPPRVPRMTD